MERGYGLAEEREESLPQYTAPLLLLAPFFGAEPSQFGKPYYKPDDAIPFGPSGFPSPSLSAISECRPSRASTPRPPASPCACPRRAASRYSRIPVSPPPSPALHRRRINTGRHPNSLEVNASFPPSADDLNLLPSLPYNFLPEARRGGGALPPSLSLSRVGRRLPLLMRAPSLRLYKQKRRATRDLDRLMTNVQVYHRIIHADLTSQGFSKTR